MLAMWRVRGTTIPLWSGGRAEWRYVCPGLESDDVVEIVSPCDQGEVAPGEVVLVELAAVHHARGESVRRRLLDPEVVDLRPGEEHVQQLSPGHPRAIGGMQILIGPAVDSQPPLGFTARRLETGRHDGGGLRVSRCRRRMRCCERASPT